MIVVTEKEKEMKHQLLSSGGVPLWLYWFSRMVSDWILYALIACV
jgi:ABC-2 family transporter protein